MQRLGDDVRRALSAFGAGQAGMAELVARWPEIAGEQVARNAWPARIGRDGTLHIATSSSAWAFELTNMRAVVAERLRSALGDAAPRKLAFAPGRVPEGLPGDDDRAPRTVRPPGDRERGRARELSAPIGDPGLRESVEAAVAAALARGADDRRV